MTAAYRLKGAGWLIGCVAVVLGFYLVSLRVAAERKKVDQIDARIATAQRDIRALETEFDTRANLFQLERWNGDTLALAAPTAGQYVASGAALAAIDVSASEQPGTSGQVRAAALVVPAAVTPAAPVAMAAALPSLPLPKALPVAPAVIRVAAVETAPSPAATRHLARIERAERDQAAVALVRPRAVAMLDSKLLSDATLGDLLTKARHEARGR